MIFLLIQQRFLLFISTLFNDGSGKWRSAAMKKDDAAVHPSPLPLYKYRNYHITALFSTTLSAYVICLSEYRTFCPQSDNYLF